MIQKPKITGVITFPEDSPFGQTVMIEARSQNLDQVFRTEIQQMNDISVPYTLSGLSPSNDFIVSVMSSTYQDIYYPDAHVVTDAQLVNVLDSTIPVQIDFALQKGRTISGIITDSRMAGIENIDISAWSFETGVSAHTRSITDGYYTISGLPPLSDYIIAARIPEKGTFYYAPDHAVRTMDTATRISTDTDNQSNIVIVTWSITFI